MLSRAATPADSAAITEIYNQGIEDRIATFESRPRDIGEIEGWFDRPFPRVVVEAEGEVIAFASTSAYRARACYAGIADFSVYVRRSHRGQGAGRLAMEALIRSASEAGFWKLVSRVFVENRPSRRMLGAVGFREVGRYERHARLDGRWRDVIVVEILLPAAYEEEPSG